MKESVYACVKINHGAYTQLIICMKLIFYLFTIVYAVKYKFSVGQFNNKVNENGANVVDHALLAFLTNDHYIHLGK